MSIPRGYRLTTHDMLPLPSFGFIGLQFHGLEVSSIGLGRSVDNMLREEYLHVELNMKTVAAVWGS